MLRMVVTDLDGTLLNSNSFTSRVNADTLKHLGKLGITRTIATGRSPYSVERVIAPDYPVDYIVFSSGAGIIRWQDKQLIHQRHLSLIETQFVIDTLIDLKVDFMVHDPIPHNHCFSYYKTGANNPDFVRRIEAYSAFCQPYINGIEYPNGATQLLAVLPNDPKLFAELSCKFFDLKVIRTTSPLDGDSIWMEIFPKDVSKAYGVKWLCNYELNVGLKEVITIGNDFNDLDMLELTKVSYVVDNAPEDLKESNYKVVSSNDDNGFSEAVLDAISILR